MNPFKASLFDMGVDLRGGDAGMSKHHLNGSKVSSMF